VQRGTVRRVADFGVFVELESNRGKWGLCHFSQIREVAQGEKIDVGAEMAVDDKVLCMRESVCERKRVYVCVCVSVWMIRC
jgi:predicted RNA-binding protein with RPS1 domain